MKLRSLFAIVLLFSFGLMPLATSALSDSMCQSLTKTILKSWLKKFGGSEVAGATSDWLKVEGVVVTYYAHPDDDRLNAALEKLLESGADKFFPTLSLTVKAGKFIFGTRTELGKPALAVNEIIELAKQSQLKAFVCGAPGLRPQFASQGFFELDAMRSRGITCDNFAQKVYSSNDLETIKTLWFGYYSRLLKEQMGDPNKPDPYVDDLLKGGWETIELGWETNRGAEIIAGLRNEIQHSRDIDPTDTGQCTAEALATPTPSPKPPTPSPKPTPTPIPRSAHGCLGFNGVWRTSDNSSVLISDGKVYGVRHTATGPPNVNPLRATWSEPSDSGTFTLTMRPGGDTFDADEHDVTKATHKMYSATCVYGPPTPPPATPTPAAPIPSHCPGAMVYYPGLGCRLNPGL